MRCAISKRSYKTGADYRVIILDIDGTLYYQTPLRICMAFKLCMHYAVHLNRFGELLRLRDFRKLHEQGQLTQPDSITAYWMEVIPLKYIFRFRDKKLLAMMQELRKDGVKIVVYSDYPVEKKLDALQFEVDYYFSASDAEINCLKPDTRGIKYIIDVVNEPVKKMLFIGDRYEKDGKCAEGVGMDYCILAQNPIVRYIQLRNIQFSGGTL